MLKRENIYTASLFDSNELSQEINKMTMKGRPENQSYESLLLIRNAWDIFDVL